MTLFSVILHEHYREPLKYLLAVSNLLSENGYLFIDVPNTSDFIDISCLDDHFYDKHLSYFTQDSLLRLLSKASLKVIWHRSSGNGCLEYLVIKDSKTDSIYNSSNHVSASENIESVALYSKRLEDQRSTLPDASRGISSYSLSTDYSLVAFGAGRILDLYKLWLS